MGDTVCTTWARCTAQERAEALECIGLETLALAQGRYTAEFHAAIDA